MLGQALLLASYGFFIFPVWNLEKNDQGALQCACPEKANCGSPGKHPLVKTGLLAATTATDQIQKWWKKNPEANIGVNAEKSGLLVLDVDPRNGGNESLAELEQQHGELPATYEVTTGSGGRHFYFRHIAVKSKPVAPGLDIKSKGGYVVGPGSLHKSGRVYEATLLGDARGFILQPPTWLVDLCTKDQTKPKPAGAKAVPVEEGLFGAALQHSGALSDLGDVDRRYCKCPFGASHTTGKDFDGSTIVFAPENGGINGYVHCSHSHCAARKQTEFWLALPEESRAHARSVIRVSPLYDPAQNDQPDWKTNWRSSLLFDEKGKLKRVLANAAIILKNHDGYKGCLGYDAFKESYFWLISPPAIVGLDGIEPGPVRDEHFVQISYYLAARYDLPEFSAENVFQIMRSAAIPFHPVRDYLNRLEWDQTPRVMKWLSTYLGAHETPYTKLVGSWWLVSAIARIFEPGCKADHVLILEGKQGSKKSTALRTLAHPWFADTPIALDNKDAYQALRGVWIYELQELQSLSKADSDRAKAFFSSPVDLFRKPYDRTTVEIKRQCVFAGTVNYEAYLKDASGNRRYWPVSTGEIDIEALIRDRDQLWAEALHLYNLGYLWYPVTHDEHALCEDEQEERLALDEDPWTESVRRCTEGLSTTTVYDVLSNPNFPNNKKEIRDAMRVAAALRACGWRKHHSNSGKVWKKEDRT